MRVLVTGGTGFVGCHSVKALCDAGHDVTMLVRAPERVRAALDPLGAPEVAYAVGDVTDPKAVRQAGDGCEAVLHCASVFAFSGRRAKEMAWVNLRGARVVLGTARELRFDPIVHVSSIGALMPPVSERPLTADSPIGRPAGPYGRSKAAQEAIARQLQHDGVPVVTTRLGAVFGPHDPHLGEMMRFFSRLVQGRAPVVLPTPLAITDVRDIAAVHAAVMEPGQGPRRYLVTGQDLPMADVFDVIRRLTGRRLPAARFRARLAQRTFGNADRVPGDLEALWFMLQDVRTDASATQAALGVRFRPAEESIADTIRWLHASGRIDDHRAGQLAHDLPEQRERETVNA